MFQAASLMSKTEKLNLLAFSPHPDDAELFCGGLLALMAQSGYRTGICDLTKGELGSQGSPEIRLKEAKAAGEILGLAHRENLGLPDGAIGEFSSLTHDAASQLSLVVACIRRLRPSLILAPYWAERHPDHVQASELVTRAVFFAGLRKYQATGGASFAPAQLLYYPMRQMAKPSFVVDITSVYPSKLGSIYAHQSQVVRESGIDAPSTPTLVSSPLSVQSIQSRDEYFGAMIGVKQGEGYITKNMLSIADPVEFFQGLENRPALLFPEV